MGQTVGSICLCLCGDDSYSGARIPVTIVPIEGKPFDIVVQPTESVITLKARIKGLTVRPGTPPQIPGCDTADIDEFFLETEKWYLKEGVGITMSYAGVKPGDAIFMRKSNMIGGKGRKNPRLEGPAEKPDSEASKELPASEASK
mmetsp:Transcript_81586/g.144075  ORF Transcript_81586/g.144075 Transcript_81586/m.144075 type:complete len:145 (-) Transcript_81586:156-590(-)